jgi:DNA primase
VARVPQEARFASEVSVERLAEARGLTLKRKGKDLIGICPLHTGKGKSTATLKITPKTNTWACSKCKTGGGPIEWIMGVKKVSYSHAVDLLHGGGVEDGHVFDPEVDDNSLLTAVVGFYHSTLKESPEGLAYLESRGLKSAEMIETFKLGLADRTLGYRLPDRRSRGGRKIRERLQEIGVLRNTGHEIFSGSLVIPIFDTDGVRVRGMYGRKITEGLRPGTPLHVYSPDLPGGVWNERGLVGGEVILTSSLIDALTFWAHGIKNVTATFGSALPDDHRAAFMKLGVKKVVLAFRRDEAGDAAVENMGITLNAMGMETARVLFPLGMDANDYTVAGKSLAEAVRHGEWMGKASATVTDDVIVRDDPIVTTIPTTTIPKSATSTTTIPKSATLPSSVSTPMSAIPGADEMVFTFGDRRWRVRGIESNTSHGDLKVNVLVTRERAGFHIDTLDLYSARHRLAFIKQAAIEIGVTDDVVKKELGAVLLELEARVDEQIRARLKPVEKAVPMTDEEQTEAVALLGDPNLCERIVTDLERVGLVGERSNKLLAYIAAVSRKLDNPLAVIVQSSSAAGKTSLVDAVLDMVPPEDRVSFSAMTGQSLFYMDVDLRHKVLAVAEGEGAARASYPLKLLQSEGRLSIASTGKDPVTGKLVTHTYTVTGPVATMLTTTAIDLDDELMNRSLVLTVDEGPEQTRAIHVAQRSRETLAGVLARRDRDRITRVHRNAQRLLRPLVVVNPLADSLTFHGSRTRARRDHMKFLGLVRAIALLHQHQRPVKFVEHGGENIEFIEVTATDIELATKLLADVLGHPEDELPPVTRNILGEIQSFIAARAKAESVAPTEVRFTQRELRAHLGMGYTQVTTHLRRLEVMEYVSSHRTHRIFRYALTYEPELSGRTAISRGSLGHLSGAEAEHQGVRDDDGKDAFQGNGRPFGDPVNGAPVNPGRT